MLDDYDSHRIRSEREYNEAWEACGPEFRAKCEAIGIRGDSDIDGESHALEYHPEYINASYCEDYALSIDTRLDELTEIHGADARPIINAVMSDLQILVVEREKKEFSLKLSRVIMMILGSEKKNVLAVIHQIIHAIPGLARHAGFPSLRSSAKECGVSPEWMRKGRDAAAQMLDIPVPHEGRKSDEAKEKYKLAATERHWRRQIFSSKSQTATNHTTPNEPTSNPD